MRLVFKWIHAFALKLTERLHRIIGNFTTGRNPAASRHLKLWKD